MPDGQYEKTSLPLAFTSSLPSDPQSSRSEILTIKAFIIHLRRAVERVGQIEQICKELPFDTEVIGAVDGSELSIKKFYYPSLHKPHYPFRLSQNEIACFLSHRKVWQAIIDQNLDAGLILEDDVKLTRDFAPALQLALEHLPEAGFIRLPHRDNRENGIEIASYAQARLIRPQPVGLGTVAQLVSQDAARTLLNLTSSFDRPIDTFLQMTWITGLRPLTVIPSGVKEVSADLGGSTMKKSKSLSQKIYHEIMRPIYRRQVRNYSRL